MGNTAYTLEAIKRYRKSIIGILITSAIICVICFMTNPSDEGENIAEESGDKTVEMTLEARIFAESEDGKTDASEVSEVYYEESPIFLSPDEAINHAIIEHNEGMPELTAESSIKYHPLSIPDDTDSGRHISCCSFVTLDEVPAAAESGDESDTHTVTYYGWALYQKYLVSDSGIEDISGSHLPVALTFDLNEYGYNLTEYWEPDDVSYVSSIKDKFPPRCLNDAIDSQKFIYTQKQSCYKQAVMAMDMDAQGIIEHLMAVICEPGEASNPQDYIDAHSLEFRELIYYGEYTVDYFIQQYGSDSADTLQSQILQRACLEISIKHVDNVNGEEQPALKPLIW